MAMLTQPEVILTHESDLDGFFSGLLLQRLAQKLFGQKIRIEAFHYNFWRMRDLREKSAWVTDFTFEPRLDKANWLVIDHHVTPYTAKNAQLIHDTHKSAGTLCYELCKEHGLASPALDRLAHLNNVSDLFLEKDPDFDVAGDYAGLVKNYSFWTLYDLIGGELEKLLDHPLLQVVATKRKIEDPIGLEWCIRHVSEITPTIGYVENIVGNTNLIVHQMLERKATKYSVIVTLFRRANNIFVSFRSRGGEALKVAETFQGGGHANASGAILPKSVRTIEDGLNFLRLMLQPQAPAASASLNNLGSLLDGLNVK